MFIVPEKPLMTVEGRDTPYANTKNAVWTLENQLVQWFKLKYRVKPYRLIAHVRFE